MRLAAASRKTHPQNGQKASSFAPSSQGAPLAYHMTPEEPDPQVKSSIQKTGRKMHAPKFRRGGR